MSCWTQRFLGTTRTIVQASGRGASGLEQPLPARSQPRHKQLHQRGQWRHRRLAAQAVDDDDPTPAPPDRDDPWEEPTSSSMPEEGLEHPESSTAAEGASASTPEAGPGRGSEDVWQDPLTSGAQQQDAAQGAAEPPDVAAAAARNEAASSTDAPGEEASTELPGADLLAGSGLSGAANAMADKEQEEAQLEAASAVIYDDRPPGPVYIDSPTTLHRHTEELKPWGYPEEYEWMDLGPQWQAPDHAQVDSLEKHVELSFEQATDPTREPVPNEDNTKYWMSEPEGGWAQKHKWVRVAKTIETPRGWNGRHAGQGRTELHNLVLGDYIRAPITSLILFEGIQVDIGAQWDGLIGVPSKAWEYIGMQLKVRQEIVVRIHQVVMTPRCRYPVQLELIEPQELCWLMMPLECWEPSFEGDMPLTERELERMRDYVPPGQVRDVVSKREAALAELAIQPGADRRTMFATEKRLQEQLRSDTKQKARRAVSRGNAPASQISNAGDQRILQRFREAMMLPNVFMGDDDSNPNDFDLEDDSATS